MSPILLTLIFPLFILTSETPFHSRFLSLNLTKQNNSEINIDNSTDILSNIITTDLIEETTELNITNKKTDSKNSSIEKEPGTYLLSFLILFLFMAIYMICQMKKYEETKNRQYDVYRFIWYANNGALIGAGIEFIFVKNVYIASSVVIVGVIIFIIGAIYFINKYSKNCDKEAYFNNAYLKEIFGLPCFIWALVSLTDPCCRCDTYTETTYADGHKEDNYCCVACFNCFMLLFKRLIVIMTFLSFYIFAVLFALFWYIAKVTCCSKTKNNTDNNNNNNTTLGGNVPTNNGYNEKEIDNNNDIMKSIGNVNQQTKNVNINNDKKNSNNNKNIEDRISHEQHYGTAPVNNIKDIHNI